VIVAEELRVGAGTTVEASLDAVNDVQDNLIAQRREGTYLGACLVPQLRMKPPCVGDRPEGKVFKRQRHSHAGIFKYGDIDDLVKLLRNNFGKV